MFGSEMMIRMGRRAGIALCVLLAACHCAFALDPALDVSQYAHTAWTIRDGFAKGTISSIAQTPDGYLWLGTEFGALRFDGVRSIPWKPPPGQFLPSNSILSLLAARDGSLWIGTTQGIASWKNGKLIQHPQVAGYAVVSLLETKDGTIWAGARGVPAGRLCAIHTGGIHCYGQDGSFGCCVLSLYSAGGYLWALAPTGLWQWAPGPPKQYPMSSEGRAQALSETDDGHLLIAMQDGIRELVDNKVESYRIRARGRQFKPANLLRDRDGGLWVGTVDGGLLHVHNGRTDRFARPDGLTGDDILSFFEDREGNVWVATVGGLDRFRDIAVPTISVKQGLSTDAVWSVLAARDGSVWLGTRDGLNRWNNGQVTIFRKTGGLPDDALESLFQDTGGRIWAFTRRGLAYFESGRFVLAGAIQSAQVHGITSDHGGSLWLSGDQNLFRVVENRVVEQIPWSRLETKEAATALLPSGEEGGLWLGFRLGRGVIYLKDSQIRQSYTAADGLGAGAVAGLKLDPDGALWAATEGGLSRIKNGRVTTLTSRNGLPCDTIHWVMEDDDHSFWLYTACGLVRIARTALEAWAANPARTIQGILFDAADGVRLSAIYASGYGPRVAKAIDGKLWFVTEGGGVSVIDLRHLPVNKLPPPVHIEQIVADRKIHWQNVSGTAASNLRLPPLSHDLQIDYTALSFVAPEKVRFKYKLEGEDRDWQDAVNRRQAFYTNLAPGHYRFRVMASNSSGVWNETGDSLEFSFALAYYQTTWFRALCVAAFLASLWGLYRYRLRQIQHEFRTRMEERTRIARELHDTLLQTFHGLMLRLQVVDELLPPGKAKEELEQTLDCADQAIIESRNAVHDLRSSALTNNDLAHALRALGDEWASESSATFRLVVEGQSRDLHPIIRDEFYRIGREALRNAFRHARANHVEAEIVYAARLLRLRIRDDGDGIPPEILEQGRSGHYGLPGMRERARQIGSKLSIWSRMGAGTEIELSVRSSIAYNRAAGSRFRLFRKKAG
jgi:signal transduction histidine kinase/ligand-binding sensor domain-containing protein